MPLVPTAGSMNVRRHRVTQRCGLVLERDPAQEFLHGAESGRRANARCSRAVIPGLKCPQDRVSSRGGATAPTHERRRPLASGLQAAPLTPFDDGVDMRTILTLTGLAAGVALTITVQRWAPYALVWLFSRGDD